LSNQYAKILLDRAMERFSIDSTSMAMSEWISKNTTLKKRPFSFKGYEFQKDIVDDMHPDLNVIKISQVGMTEVQIRKALGFLKRNRGTSLIFSLPNEDMYERVSKARVKPIVNADKVFNTPEDSANKAVRSTEMMQFGQSFLYLVPAIESAATSIPADVVMNDEVDLSDQKMISLFNSRLQASKFRISQKFSTPTFPSYGIDLNWQVSDQRLYMCLCEQCGHWNHPEFTRKFIHIPGAPETIKDLTELTITYQDTIDLENAYVMCEKCQEPLDLDNPALRQWVATYPDRKNVRGYRITPFVNSNLNIKYIFKTMWDFQKNEFMRGFYNTVLGLPYSDGNMQIPQADIEECMKGAAVIAPNLAYIKTQKLWVGIDMGQVCHVTIGVGNDRDNVDAIAFYQVKVADIVEHCKKLCEDYNIGGGCVDRHPYEPTAREIFEVTKGLIIPAEYRGMKDVNPVLNEMKDITHIQVNRTFILDNVASKIKKHKIKLGGYGYQRSILIEHLRNMVRDEVPSEPAKWVKLNENDHYFHSLAFMLISAYAKDVIQSRDNEEVKTMFFTQMLTSKDKTSNLIGMSKKKLDTSVVTRL
jgi:hypothetical protein